MKNTPDYQRLLSIINEVHIDCFELCKVALGKYLPIAGNIGIFCQSDLDYEILIKIREEITEPSDNPNQKYYRLRQPIVIAPIGDIPETTYTHLYIRKPSKESPEAGDVDFVLSVEQYNATKQKLLDGEKIRGASIYVRPGWDNIEIRDPKINALTYVSTQAMAEKVRVKF